MSQSKEGAAAETIWEEHWQRSANAATRALQTAFTRHAYATLRSMIDERDERILEAGSGTGRFCYLLASEFPNADVYGLDYSLKAVSMASAAFQRPNLRFIRGDLFCLPFKRDAWDVVFSEGVIEHFPLDSHGHDYVTAVREMARVARPGGKVIIGVPNAWCFPHVLWKALVRHRYEYGYEKSFRPMELRALMERIGLEVVSWRGFDPVHGLFRYARIIPGFGRVTGLLQRVYSATRDSFGGMFDVFGHEFFMCGKKPC